MERVIISRHRAAVEFIAACLGGDGHTARVGVGCVEVGAYRDPDSGVWLHPDALAGDDRYEWAVLEAVPVLAEAKPGDVRGKVVYGNLPLHLCALAAEVWAVEFDGPPPRGQEYGVEDMRRAGARLARYVVRRVD